MKISFVIPAYNEEDYIGDCLKSVKQELINKQIESEIIVVNNASSDKTEEIAKSFEGVKVVYEAQKGLVPARNAGYKASSGDIIANIDADTKLTKGWVDTVIKEFGKDPKLAALSGPFIYHDVSKKMRRIVRVFYYYVYYLYFVNRFILRVGSVLQGGNFVFRKSYFEKINGYNLKEFTFYGEDADIAIRLNKVGRVKWTFKLPIYSSGRRIAGEGPFTMTLRYSFNYFWVLMFKKPFSKGNFDIRFKKHFKTLRINPRDKRGEYISAGIVISSLVFLPVATILIGYNILLPKSTGTVTISTRIYAEAKTIGNKIDSIINQISIRP